MLPPYILDYTTYEWFYRPKKNDILDQNPHRLEKYTLDISRIVSPK